MTTPFEASGSESGEGATLGSYRLVEPVGEGDLFRAWDEALDRLVLVRRLGSLGDAERQKVRAWARFEHPGFLRVLDLFDDSAGRSLVVFEHVEAWTLGGLSEEWSPVRAAALGAEIVESLAAARKEGLGPVGLAPSSVFVGPDGRILLVGPGRASEGDGDGLAGLLRGLVGRCRLRRAPALEEILEGLAGTQDAAGLEAGAEELRRLADGVGVGAVRGPAGRGRFRGALAALLVLAVGGAFLVTMGPRDRDAEVTTVERRQTEALDRLARGREAGRRGDFGMARSSFELALVLDPGLAEAHLGLAGLHLDAGRPDLARAHLEAVRSLRPLTEEEREQLDVLVAARRQADPP